MPRECTTLAKMNESPVLEDVHSVFNFVKKNKIKKKQIGDMTKTKRIYY